MSDTFYEIYYRIGDTTIYCGDTATEEQAIYEVTMLENEWSNHEYWYEAVQV